MSRESLQNTVLTMYEARRKARDSTTSEADWTTVGSAALRPAQTAAVVPAGQLSPSDGPQGAFLVSAKPSHTRTPALSQGSRGTWCHSKAHVTVGVKRGT